MGLYRCWKSQIFSYQMTVVGNFLKYYLCSLLLWSCSIYCWVLSVDSRRCTNITSNVRLCNYFDNTFQFHWFPFQTLPSYLVPFYSKVLMRRGVCRNPGQNLAGRLLVCWCVISGGIHGRSTFKLLMELRIFLEGSCNLMN